MHRINQLILYRPEEGSLLFQISRIFEGIDQKEQRSRYFACMNELVELCVRCGFSGNLWHAYLTYYLVYHENAYSRSCEITGGVAGGINQVALHDFEIIRDLFAWDFADVELKVGSGIFSMLRAYEGSDGERRLFNRRIRDRIAALTGDLERADSPAAFQRLTEGFYREFGVGKFGLHKAFRIREAAAGEADIIPITNIAHVNLEDLVGYESAKKKLVENTEAFLAGKPANNCLLFGDAGTGKSSSIKAVLNRYYDRGLRIIELYKHQFRDLNSIIDQVKNRNYRFIIYMDDLSFEDSETDYKYLKAVIEGGLEKKPDNILIYATSNRRHLIRENYADKFSGGEEIRQDMHTSDTVQEKLSLAYRFGVTIYFGAPDKKEFQNIVRVLAQRHRIRIPEEELLRAANAWELQHGGLSGRTAQQFIDHILGSWEERHGS